MSNKIRAITERLGVPATIVTANLAKGTYVKITGDATVDKTAAEDDVPVGFVRKTSASANGSGTIETRGSVLVDAQCKGAIAAGDRVKVGDTVSTVQTFKKWTSGTDNPSLIVGICWIGAADTVTGTFILF